MGWISSLLANREVNRLEELAQSAPAPSVFLRLGEIYRRQGEEERAREITRRGAELFPDDKDLSAARASVERARHAAQKERLRARIEQYPNPSLFAKLATLHLQDDEIDECLAVCRESRKDFPHYGGVHIVLAQVALRREDHDTAFDHLREAVDLDKFNYMGLMLLAEEHLRRGERDEAKGVLERILEFAPGDEKATGMLRDFDALAERLARETRSRTPTERVRASSAEKPAIVPPPSAAQPAEGPTGASGGAGGRYEAALDELVGTEGVEGCLLIDRFGLVVASRTPETLDEEMTGALVTNIFRASANAADPFGLGRIEEGVIESEAGCAFLMDLEDMVVAVFGAPNAKPGLLQQAVRTFTRSVVSASA